MFGFPRLQALLGEHADGDTVKEFLLAQLADFTGPNWEQEDDVTLVTLQRKALPAGGGQPAQSSHCLRDSVRARQRAPGDGPGRRCRGLTCCPPTGWRS